jgi:hypothetical protein
MDDQKQLLALADEMATMLSETTAKMMEISFDTLGESAPKSKCAIAAENLVARYNELRGKIS